MSARNLEQHYKPSRFNPSRQNPRNSDDDNDDLHKPSLLRRIYEYRTPFDKSDHSCIENIARGTVKSFAIGYSVKAGLVFFKLLGTIFKSPNRGKKILAALFNQENLRFGLFLGLFTGILKLVISFLRILTKRDHGSYYFAAGFLGAYLSLFLLPKSGRMIWVYFLLPRAFDCFYNHLVIKGKLKKRSWHYVLLFALMNTFTVYCYTGESYLVPPSIEKFYTMVMNSDDNDLIIRRLCSEMARRRIVKTGAIKDVCHPLTTKSLY